MKAIEKIITTNFYSDYDRLTNGFFKGVVCVIGIGCNFEKDIFREQPCIFMLKDKSDFSFGKIQVLLEKFRNIQILLGIKLAFIDDIRLDDDIVRLYRIFNKQIRCL